MLGNFKKKMGVRRERAPFVLTPAMAYVMGGAGSAKYREFEELCCRAFNVLRRHSNLLLTLFTLMLNVGLPELRRAEDIYWLRDHLLIGKSEEEAAKHFKQQITVALNTKMTQLNDAVHLLVHA